MSLTFYLGTHEVNWLGKTAVPLFVSHVRLRQRKTLPRAQGPWSLDSGAFSELAQHGRWTTSDAEYVEAVHRYAEQIGGLEWAAPMDWMCEPFMIERTGLSVLEHQERTVANYLRLRGRGPFVPVLQGWTLDDYRTCVGMYEAAGIALAEEPVVGLGSVCRRQHTAEIGRIVSFLHDLGIRCHGFGVKLSGLASYGYMLESADSMAWSYDARRAPALAGCTHRNCANCLEYALRWRRRVNEVLGQQRLEWAEAA